MSDAIQLGVIGGSGLYGMDGVEDLQWVSVDTPFGPPSDDVGVGRIDGVPVAFLSRHGRGHKHAPHEINYRANIWALKSLGVRWLVSVSAVGSMRESIVPGDLVLVDQFIDRTRARPSTFFEGGVVAHVMFSDPVCGKLQRLLVDTSQELGLRHHDGGSYVCIDGPQFSTRAESLTYRSWDVSVVGMTNLPEARLAREAQIAYATVALATDYDCWHESEDDVSVEAVLAIIRDNVFRAQRLVRAIAPRVAGLGVSRAWSALENAVMSQGEPDADTLERVGLFLGDREHHGGAA
jgi:5'-methylthioadenosine phosphorylase